MSELDRALAHELHALAEAGLARELADGEGTPVVVAADFCSNDYLGLARHPDVVAAAVAALREEGAGARAARLLGGGGRWHARAEAAAAEWQGTDAALLFASGWHANLGVIGALAGRGDLVFSDERNHASLIDGCRLARAAVRTYRHHDVDELDRALGRAGSTRRRFVVTESIFSMDGDLAPLARLHEVSARHGAWLIVDEAHAVGLLGPNGRGAWIGAGLPPDAPALAARVITGGKALGSAGAFVVGSRELCGILLQRARSFLFTTAPPPAVAAALHAAIGVAAIADELRARALAVARDIAAGLGLPRPVGAIVSYVIGNARDAVRVSQELRARGLDVRAVRPPTVPEGSSRLRIVGHAFNGEAEVAQLVAAVRECVGNGPPPAAPSPSRTQVEPWFVVGTDTGVGKTVVSALLLRAARPLGGAAYWKPVQTGEESDTAAVRELAAARDDELVENEYLLPRPASPHEAAAHAGVTLDPERIVRRLEELRARFPGSRLVIELAGGLLVPYRAGADPFLQIDWLARTRGRIVLVARSGVGTLNHTLLTLEALRARHLEPAALFLVGALHPDNAAALRDLAAVARQFELPLLAELDAVALDRWLETNDVAGALEG